MCWMAGQHPEINLEEDVLPIVKNLILHVSDPEQSRYRNADIPST